MKKFTMVLAALFAALTVWAQEPRLEIPRLDSLRTQGFQLPDSLAHLSPWRPDYTAMQPIVTKPKISMSSLVVIQRENLPGRVTVINNNTLRLGPRFNLSNGQAWNWSPFPDAYLDARTLSFPMPR